jgi:hypothetical protein
METKYQNKAGLSPAALLVQQGLEELGLEVDQLLRKRTATQDVPIHPDRIWDGSEQLLRLFFNLLQDNRLIGKEEKWENFKIPFLTGNKAMPIRWLGTIVLLVCMIDQLRNMDDMDKNSIITPCDQPHKLLQAHFQNKSGKKIGLGVLRSSLEKGVRHREHERIFEYIIKKIEKEWVVEKMKNANSSTP